MYETKFGDNRITWGFEYTNFVAFLFCPLTNLGGQTLRPTFTQNCLNDLGTRKDVPFVATIKINRNRLSFLFLCILESGGICSLKNAVNNFFIHQVLCD